MVEKRARSMTDDDVQALADELETRLANRFYGNLGRGLWSMVWRAIVLGCLAVAAYGSMRGH